MKTHCLYFLDNISPTTQQVSNTTTPTAGITILINSSVKNNSKKNMRQRKIYCNWRTRHAKTQNFRYFDVLNSLVKWVFIDFFIHMWALAKAAVKACSYKCGSRGIGREVATFLRSVSKHFDGKKSLLLQLQEKFNTYFCLMTQRILYPRHYYVILHHLRPWWRNTSPLYSHWLPLHYWFDNFGNLMLIRLLSAWEQWDYISLFRACLE